MSETFDAASFGVDQLAELLVDPQEDMRTEVKGWLDLSSGTHCAILARAMIALANYGGGRILLGFGGRPLAMLDEPGGNLDAVWNTDQINGIVGSYLDPPLHCHVRLIRRPGVDRRFPVVLVPGITEMPIRARRGSPDNGKELRAGAYYVRQPGPKSGEPTPTDWDDIIKRIERNRANARLDAVSGDVTRLQTDVAEIMASLAALLRLVSNGELGGSAPSQAEPTSEARIVDWMADGVARWNQVTTPLPEGEASRMHHGHYCVGYIIIPAAEPIPLAALRDLLAEITVRHTGWPPFWIPTRPDERTYAQDGVLECFRGARRDRMFADPAHSDFWRAAPDGRMFLLRGFDEDSYPDRLVPGTALEVWSPGSRVGEVLLHAGRLARRLDRAEAEVLFRIEWTGLEGRALTSRLAPEYFAPSLAVNISQDRVASTIRVRVADIPDRLAGPLASLLRPLFELFDLQTPSEQVMENQISRLLRTRL